MTVAVNVPPAATFALAASAPPAWIETVAPSGSAARPGQRVRLAGRGGLLRRVQQHAVHVDVAAHRRMQLAVVGDVPGASKRCSNVLDISSRGEAQLPSSALTLWARTESLCQVTVSPASTSRCGFANDAL